MHADTNTHSVRGYCTLCRSRCGAVYTVTAGRLTSVSPDPQHPTGGALCTKGRAAPELVASPDRLMTPLRRTRPKGDPDPGWRKISWTEALDHIAREMQRFAQESGPESVVFSTTTPSGSGISDSVEWIESFVRVFGSPNLIAAVELCNFQKDYGHALTFGRPLGTPDYANADLIVLWGHNPARTWLAQANIISARRPDAKLVVIDPQRGGSGQQADLWLGIRPGTDACLALGGIHHLLAQRQYNAAFVRQWTDATLLVSCETGLKLRADSIGAAHDQFVAIDEHGALTAVDTAKSPAEGLAYNLFFDGLVMLADGQQHHCRTSLSLLAEQAAMWPINRVADITGLRKADILAFYGMLGSANRVSYFLWTGTAQNAAATQTTRAIASLFALRDDVDQVGGNRWLTSLPARRLPLPDVKAPALGIQELPLGPPRYGYITVADFCTAVENGTPYPVRALIGFGTNILASHPHAERTAAALALLDLQVHCDLFMTPTAAMADIVLPVTVPWEHEALRIGFEISEAAASHVQIRPRVVKPRGDQRPDYAIVRDLARRLGFDHAAWNGPIESAWDWILEPLGLDSTGLRLSPGGRRVEIDHPVGKHHGRGPRHSARGFDTPSRLIELHSEALWVNGQPATAQWQPAVSDDPTFPILMTTAKSGYYTHSSLRNVPSLRARSPDPAIDISPLLATKKGIIEGDWCRVHTAAGVIRMRARLNADLLEDVAIAEFGWWQGSDANARINMPAWGPDSGSINAILGQGERDPISGVPSVRHAWCNIHRDPEASYGNWAGQRIFLITQRWPQAGDVMEFELTPADGKAVPCFQPGQHVPIMAEDRDLLRFYSLVSPALPRQSTLRIAVRYAPKPTPSMSTYLHHDAKLGDRLMLYAPRGRFVIPLLTQRPVVCIAGGIGVTPFLSYLRTADTAVLLPPSVSLHLAGRSVSEAPFHDELTALAERIPGIHYRFHRSVPGTPESLMGWMDDVVSSAFTQPHNRPLFYTCGPPGMMKAMAERLHAAGAQAGDVHSEVFENANLPKGPLQDAVITLARSGTQFQWSAQMGSILEASARAGVALPSGCRVGQCESCALRVTAGTVSSAVPHQLGPDVCLTCCSAPVGNVTFDA